MGGRGGAKLIYLKEWYKYAVFKSSLGDFFFSFGHMKHQDSEDLGHTESVYFVRVLGLH